MKKIYLKTLLTFVLSLLFGVQGWAYTISLNSDKSKVIVDFTTEKSMTGYGTSGGQNYNWAYTLTGDNSGTIPKSFVIKGECSDPLSLLSQLPYGPEYIDMSAMTSTTTIVDVLSAISTSSSQIYTITGIVLPKGSSIPEDVSMLSNCTELGYVIAPNNDATSATILVTKTSLTNINEDILSSVTNIDISTTVSNISSNLLATLRATGASVNYNSNNDQEGNTDGEGGNTDGEGGNTDGEGGNTDGEGGNTDTDNLTLDQKIQKSMQLTDVPTIYLTIPAAEGKDLNTIVKKITDPALDPYFDATIQVVDNSPETSEKHLESFTDEVKIKVRGNSTANMDKRPYRLKFGKDVKDPVTGKVTVTHKHDLLGDGYMKRNWTLLANAYDGSKIRNALNYYIGELVGMEFRPGYKFVDLVINREYRGCYQVSDHVEVGSHRIDVDEDTGWYVEASRGDMIEAPSATGGSLEMSIKNPEPATKAETDQLISDVEAFFTEFGQKAASYNTNLADPTLGWRSIADEESMVAFYIGTNLTANYDGFMTVKMFRDVTGKDTKLHFGPLWDMDLAYGHFKGSEPGKLVENIDNGNFRWYPKGFMENDARFVKKVHDKWHSLVANGLIDNLNTYIDKLADNVRQSQELDYTKKWTVRMKGMDGTYESFDAAIAYLKGFIAAHVPLVQEYIDGQYVELHCADLPDEPEDVDPTDPDDKPTGDLGALKDLGNGKYSYTGSASTFKEGTEITITTSTEGTTLSNYITEGNEWNATKTITLTADDVTTLAANSYTFFMNATGGEVKAVNVKVPEAPEVTGLEDTGEQRNNGNLYIYRAPKSAVKVGATLTITISGGSAMFYTSNKNTQFDGLYWGTTYTKVLDQALVDKIIANNYSIDIVVSGGTCTSAEITSSSSGGSSDTPTTPTYALTLSASPAEGGTVTGTGTYEEGTTVLIKAIPNEGYRFSKWSDDNTYASRSVTLNEAITLTATFVSDDTPATRQQLTNLPTIYLDAATVDDAWKGVALEVFDKDNVLGQGITWTKTTADVSAQYQGSGDKNKDSYRLKFETKTQLLSSGKFKQWVLLANDDDPTMMRNALAKEMGDVLGLPFTPGYQFVDLYVNDAYMGTYQITDRIKVESGRALVTGGNKDDDWHIRFNDAGEYNEDKPTYYIEGTTTAPYIIPKNPDPKDNPTTWNSTLKSAMTKYFNNVFATTDGKYTAFADNVDHQQLIQWYIAQEMLGVYKGFSSIEAYRSVTVTDQNLHIGVLWDSEKAFGNTGEAPAIDMSDLEAKTYNGLMTNYAAYGVFKNIFTQLWQERWFANGVNNLWKEKHEAMLSAMTTKAAALKTELEGSWAQNATKWSITGEQTTSINAMTAWLTERDAYLTKKFAAFAAALPCENHTYENNNYIKQDNGTYLVGCDVCGTIKEDSETYYKFTVYPESAAKTEVIATSWHPSAEHPNSYATVTITPSGAESSISGYNIINTTKNAGGDKTCADFRLTDGHPYYGDDGFVATKATYTRNISNEWGTLCLPFKTQKATTEYADFYHLGSVKNDNKNNASTLVFTPVQPEIDGNASAFIPVVFRATAKAKQEGKIVIEATNVSVKKTTGKSFIPTNSTVDDWTLIGTMEQKHFANVASELASGEQLYYIAQNKFWQATTTYTNNPFRAYFIYAPSTPSAAKVSMFSISTDDNLATDVTSANATRPLAIFTNTGSVSIVAPRDMKVSIYSANGMLVETIDALKDTEYSVNLAAGIYMVNGLKFVVK